MDVLKFRARIKENGKPKIFYQNDQYLISFLRRVTSFLAFEKDNTGGTHESYLQDHELEKCLDLSTGLFDKNKEEIYSGDIVYLAGYGNYEVKFPFIELYEAYSENDIGEIIGNVYETNKFKK